METTERGYKVRASVHVSKRERERGREGERERKKINFISQR